MNIDNLVGMANQIGTFYEAMPDREEALEGITDHIRKFWAPRMRRQLTAWWSDGQGDDLRPIVRDALAAHSILPTPVPVRACDPDEAAKRHAFDGTSES